MQDDRIQIDQDARIVHCRSCSAEIWWGNSVSGKLTPFDVTDGQRTSVSHFATCPQADRWRKRETYR